MAIGGLIFGSASAASAQINDPSINQGKSGGNGYVYYTTAGPQKGVQLPVYETRMASFPAGKQFAGVKNTEKVKRFIAVETKNVDGGTIVCVKPGGILWLDSSSSKAWVVPTIGKYTCAVGSSQRVS